jgi:hypothetical protein
MPQPAALPLLLLALSAAAAAVAAAPTRHASASVLTDSSFESVTQAATGQTTGHW